PQRATNRLGKENEAIVEAQEKLTGERETALAAAAGLTQGVGQLQKDKNELLRLRNEVGQLRRQTSELRARIPVSDGQGVMKSQTVLSPEAGLGACTVNLTRIEAAMQQCALEYNLSKTNLLTAEQFAPYLIEK